VSRGSLPKKDKLKKKTLRNKKMPMTGGEAGGSYFMAMDHDTSAPNKKKKL